MDRRGTLGAGINRVIDKVASSDVGYDKPKGVVTGFISVCDFVENGEIINNLAYLLSKKSMAVCVVDFKVFYPNLFDWFGGVSAPKKGDGLIRLLNSDRVEVKSIAQKTDDENVFLISASPNDDIEDYFNYSIPNVKRVITALKEVFDIVLIDIPNNPPLEFCVGALMNCQNGFFVASERVDAPRNIQKLVEYMLKLCDEIRNFDSIIISRKQEFAFDENSLNNLSITASEDREKLKIAARLPYVKAAQENAVDGKIYLRDSMFVNKIFAREMDKIVKLVLGVG
ncbi:MAG: hypothetical protein FWD34_01300 [Oscillospiraceae bacterium]|nr:hypothetical protein [Oscillospiraceae bacterium]